MSANQLLNGKFNPVNTTFDVIGAVGLGAGKALESLDELGKAVRVTSHWVQGKVGLAFGIAQVVGIPSTVDDIKMQFGG